MSIRDRHVRTVRVKASSLRRHPLNWRGHPDHQADAVRGALADLGQTAPLLAVERDGDYLLFDGHLRADVAGDQELRVDVYDLSDGEVALALATHDPIAAMAEMRADRMAALQEQVQTQNPALGALLERLRQAAEDVLAGDEPPPDLDALAGEHGDPGDEDFWPTIRLRVPPEVKDLYDALMEKASGEEESYRFHKLLAAVDAAKL